MFYMILSCINRWSNSQNSLNYIDCRKVLVSLTGCLHDQRKKQTGNSDFFEATGKTPKILCLRCITGRYWYPIQDAHQRIPLKENSFLKNFFSEIVSKSQSASRAFIVSQVLLRIGFRWRLLRNQIYIFLVWTNFQFSKYNLFLLYKNVYNFGQ